MDIELKVIVKAPKGEVSEYLEAYLKTKPRAGSLAEQLFEQNGTAFQAPTVDRINSQKFTATAAVRGVPATVDYELAVSPEGTEVTVTTRFDLGNLMAAEIEDALAKGEIKAEEIDEFKEALEVFVEFAMHAIKPVLEASQQEWADHFPRFIAEQKTLGASGPGDLAA